MTGISGGANKTAVSVTGKYVYFLKNSTEIIVRVRVLNFLFTSLAALSIVGLLFSVSLMVSCLSLFSILLAFEALERERSQVRSRSRHSACNEGVIVIVLVTFRRC